MIVAENLTRVYTMGRVEVRALRGVSLEVEKGEFVGIMGASGSGKSTLLHILGLLDRPTSGRVTVDGTDVLALSDHQRTLFRLNRLGYVFQDYALIGELTALENVYLTSLVRGASKEEYIERSADILRRVGLGDRMDHRQSELSGGEQQRVALARALAPDPRLLMLDEPLGALDHNLRTELLNDLRQSLRASQKPVIYVTHDQEEAFALADRLLLLHEGRLIQEGSPEEVFRQPANAWVASFLGLGNLIPAIRSENGQIQTGIGTLALPCPKSLQKDEQFSILLRPEDAHLGLTAQENALSVKAQVLDSVFFREYYRNEVTIKDQSLIVYSEQAFQPGEEVNVNWSKDAILCLPN